MKGRGVFVLAVLCLSFFSLPFASAIGLSPDVTSVPFVPLGEGELHIIVLNTEGSEIAVDLDLRGDLAKHFKVHNTEETIPAFGSKSYRISYTLPYTVEKPGKHQIIVSAKKKALKGTGISAVLNVISKIIVDVPYPGRYLEYHFDAESVNIGETLPITFYVSNKGKNSLFTIKPSVSFHSLASGEVVYEKQAEPFSLAVGGTKQVSLSLDSESIGKGDYILDTYVLYDSEETEHQNKSISIGYMDIVVINHSKTLFVGDLRKFVVEIENKWNDQIDGISIEGVIEQNNVPITPRAVSPHVDLAALQSSQVPLYFDLSSAQKGPAMAVLDIYYGNLSKKVELPLVLEESFTFTPTIVIVGVIILLILADIIWMIFESRRQKNQLSVDNDKYKKL